MGLPGERVNACRGRLRLRCSLSSVLVPVALPSPSSPPALLSGSGSPPTPCQAISALLTGHKTNLTIKSKLFFFPGIFAETAQRRADGAQRLAGERGQECTAGGGMAAAPARALLEPWLRTSPTSAPARGALGGKAVLEGAGKGSLLQQP